jgi:broad specificity phosphatase PhoE
MVLYVVRHGETAPNAAGLLLGRSDPQLTERGRTQAAGLVATLPAPDRVVSSPLRRARETAEAFGRAVEVDDRWIELDYGRLEGTDPASVPAEVWARWRENPDYAPGEGEALSALGVRVRAACEELTAAAELRAGRTVIVVTHVSPIKAAIAWALGVEDRVAWRLWVEDAGVTRIGVDRHGPVLRSFNEHSPTAP